MTLRGREGALGTVRPMAPWVFRWSLAVIMLLGLLGCGVGRSWSVEVLRADGSTFVVDADVYERLRGPAELVTGLSVDRVLWEAGHRAVAMIQVSDLQGKVHRFDWPSEASDAWWLKNGQVSIGGKALAAARIEADPPALLHDVQGDITDIAPTVAASLGLPAPAGSTGRVLDAPAASHAALIFLDGFGYVRYQEALQAGLIPHLAAFGDPLLGLTVYPPSTRVGTAALLTGAPPSVNGVDQRFIRHTELETLFDVATEAGLEVVAVEGESLAFNLPNAMVTLSGDRDGNGSTDDNVLANALTVLEQRMPDLFFVHFHGIDDAGHDVGPGRPEEEVAISGVDAAVGEVLQALPNDTLVVIFADHGMHRVGEEGRLGNHGHLIERDIFIPIMIGLE